MAKKSRKNEFGSFSPETTSVATSSPVITRAVNVAKTKTCASLTHQQIEERAREIWRQKGCPVGQDEKNWHEAETQLKMELGIE
jgi:hypothetical protein